MKTLLIALLMCGGCTSATYTVTTPTETRKFNLIRPGYDTHLGELDVVTPDGVQVHLKDLDSKEKGSQLFEKMIDKIPNAPVIPIP